MRQKLFRAKSGRNREQSSKKELFCVTLNYCVTFMLLPRLRKSASRTPLCPNLGASRFAPGRVLPPIPARGQSAKRARWNLLKSHTYCHFHFIFLRNTFLGTARLRNCLLFLLHCNCFRYVKTIYFLKNAAKNSFIGSILTKTFFLLTCILVLYLFMALSHWSHYPTENYINIKKVSIRRYITNSKMLLLHLLVITITIATYINSSLYKYAVTQ